tara:strand:+ start:1846 stop:4290 length:2445 start_codon:yes stop_codon:yes gene_type:complete
MINYQKLLNTTQSTDTQSAQPRQSFFAKANIKLVSIKNLLAGTLAVEKTKLQQKKARELQERREKTEERLETKPGAEKDRGLTNRIPRVGGMGVLGWFKNFIGSILLGFLLTKLLGARSFLEGFLKTMNNVSSFLANFGMALVNGFATFVNAGYEAYDATKGFLKDLGGEDLEKLFEGFMDKVSMLVDALIIASLIKGSGDFGPGRRRRRRGPDFPDPRGPRGPRGPGPKPPKPKRPTGERKPKTKPEGRRPRFDISRLVQLAAAVGGAVGLGVLTRGKGRALLRLLSRAGVRVPSKVLERTVSESIRDPKKITKGYGRGRKAGEMVGEVREEMMVGGGTRTGGGGTRTGGGGGRSGGGTATATGPESQGPQPFRYRKGDYFREGPRDINIFKHLTLQSLKGKERLKFMMDELIKGSINADTFQRFVFDEAKAGRLSKDDFAKFTGVGSKSSAQNLSATARAIDDARRDLAEDIASRSGMADFERRVKSPTQQMIDRLPTNREIAKARLARSRGSIEFEGMDDEEIVEYLMKKKRRRNIANIRRQRRLGGIVQGAQQSTRNIFRAARGALKKVPLKIPILFGLLDFALAYLAGDPVGRAAFSAIGAGLVGAVATAIGSALPGIGNIILGAIGGTVGAMAGEALYDFFFTGQTPTVRNEALTEEEREMLTGGVDPDLLPKSNTPNPSFDPLLHGTPPDGIPYADDPSQQPGLGEEVPFDSDFLNQDAEGLTEQQRKALEDNLQSFNFNKGKDLLAAYNNLRNFTSYENPLGTNTFIISRNEINSSSPPSLSMPSGGSPNQVALIDPGRSLMYKLS